MLDILIDKTRLKVNFIKHFLPYSDTFRDENGHYHITGRVDDVINVTGHRLGTAEVEDAMVKHIYFSSDQFD